MIVPHPSTRAFWNYCGTVRHRATIETALTERSLRNVFRPAMLGALLIGSTPIAAHEEQSMKFRPDPNGGTQFSLPSHNVECSFSPAGGTKVYRPVRGEAELSCDKAKPVYTRFNLPAHGRATLMRNPGEQPCCSDTNVLLYGRTWRMPPFDCISATTGLTCSSSDGHGFTISRTTSKVF